jgi:hypothetical protein
MARQAISASIHVLPATNVSVFDVITTLILRRPDAKTKKHDSRRFTPKTMASLGWLVEAHTWRDDTTIEHDCQEIKRCDLWSNHQQHRMHVRSARSSNKQDIERVECLSDAYGNG